MEIPSAKSLCPQCFDMVRWQEEHLASKILSDELPVWLSFWSEVHVQMICIWSS